MDAICKGEVVGSKLVEKGCEVAWKPLVRFHPIGSPQKLLFPFILVLPLALGLFACGEATPLNVVNYPYNLSLTPMETADYSERSAILTVSTGGFKDFVDTSRMGVEIRPVEGLSFQASGPIQCGRDGIMRCFEVSILYDGTTAFPEGPAAIEYSLTNPPSGFKDDRRHILYLPVFDGQTEDNPIPLKEANIQAFNSYANTEVGRKMHYRLVENVVLPKPLENENNWVAIGTQASPFSGSLNGAGAALSGLVLLAPDEDHQGLFGYIDADATVKNLELQDVNVSGKNHVGGVVGWSEGGVVHNCRSAGNVSGGNYVGGVVGNNNGGAIYNSRASGRVSGSAQIGGVAGVNNGGGTVQNSEATSNVSGNGRVGGVVGLNWSTVQDSRALGSVSGIGGSQYVGGVVGDNNRGTVQNCYATGNVNGGAYVGGVVGDNYSGGRVQDCYATGNVSGNERVGGVVGENRDAVRNCVALNPSVKQTLNNANYVGRVVGVASSGTLANNYAGNMTLTYGGTSRAPENNANSRDGLTTATYSNPNFWKAAAGAGVNWDFETVWEWGPDNLPILQNAGSKQTP